MDFSASYHVKKLPFKTYRSLFNVYLVQVISKERGADSSPGVDSKDTALGCSYGINGIPRLLSYLDEEAVVRAAKNAPAVDIIVVLVNDDREGGSGGTAGFAGRTVFAPYRPKAIRA